MRPRDGVPLSPVFKGDWWSWRTLCSRNPIPRSHYKREERTLWTPFRPGSSRGPGQHPVCGGATIGRSPGACGYRQVRAAHLRLVSAMRRWLRKRLPTAHEVVYEYRDCFLISYSPSERGYEGVLAIRGSAEEFGSTSIVVRGCRILRSCCRVLAGRRAGFTWRAQPHSLVRRSRA